MKCHRCSSTFAILVGGSGAAGDPGRLLLPVGDHEPWVKVQSEGIFGRWHMTAGEGPGYVLTACDLRLREHVLELDVDLIPANERCPVCQGQHQLREASEVL
jgi:hypothetical protein